MSDADDGFLSRWARRKARVQSGLAEPAEPPRPAPPSSPSPAMPGAVATAPPSPGPADDAAAASAPADAVPPAGREPPPTMADVARLTPDADFSRFVGAGVDRDVSNAALKTLFRDPHFNVMDGLDTYIDDYGKPDPIPPAMLRQLTQSSLLGLFDETPAPPPGSGVDAVTAPAASPDGGAVAAVAQSTSGAPSPPPGTEPLPDDDPDLRLQQDDGARRPGAAPEPGA